MCGIIGYIGSNVTNALLDGLELLEYRGYDSAGIAVWNAAGNTPDIYKCEGRVRKLRELVADHASDVMAGIGHTRWATHGGVCDSNAHPHQSGRVTLVHNGIIENYRSLIEDFNLQDKLQSETDSEVVAALMDQIYDGDPVATICRVVRKLKGTYAFVLSFQDHPGDIYAIRNVSPIVCTLFDQGAILASDPTAVYAYSNQYMVLPEYCILQMKKDAVKVTGLDGTEVVPEYQTVDWDIQSADKKEFPFYMEKEILEQPQIIESVMTRHIKDGIPDFRVDGLHDEMLKNCSHICITACGTAMYAGMIGQMMIRKWLGINAEIEMASEFIYSDAVVDENTLFIAISQSGETIDTLEAVKLARKKKAATLAVLNVRGSSISRECDCAVYTDAGPEIAVASTKAYTAQISMLYLLVLRMAYLRNKLDVKQVKAFTDEMSKIPEAVKKVIQCKDEIHHAAGKIIMASDLFMVGRGLDYTTLLEGSLKLKEVSYIHSEAYAAGELKHGPIALISQGTPVVAAVTQEELFHKEMSNVKELRSRGAEVLVFTKESMIGEIPEEYKVIALPDLPDELMPFPVVVALQLLSYYCSADKGYDVDKPRNLAKVVTVE